MTLQEIINSFNEISIKQPNISQYIKSGNIYDLSQDRNAKFSVFCVSQGTHSTNITEGYSTYNLFLYYVDRLKSDESNKIEIQSVGIETLKNIVRVFKKNNDVEIDTIDFEVFTERFSEMCAGAYAILSIVTYDENCVEEYD